MAPTLSPRTTLNAAEQPRLNVYRLEPMHIKLSVPIALKLAYAEGTRQSLPEGRLRFGGHAVQWRSAHQAYRVANA
jgi:hypothetical protein